MGKNAYVPENGDASLLGRLWEAFLFLSDEFDGICRYASKISGQNDSPEFISSDCKLIVSQLCLLPGCDCDAQTPYYR